MGKVTDRLQKFKKIKVNFKISCNKYRRVQGVERIE